MALQPTTPPRRPDLADHDRMLEAEKQSTACIHAMETMVKSVAMARQVVGLRDDRLKKELAVLQSEYLTKGEGVGASEIKARSDARYVEAIKRIMADTASAQEIVMRYDLEKTKFENAQALRNDERARMKLL